LAEAAEPAEQMGITAQLGEVEQLREIRLEIGEEVTGNAAIVARRAGSESGRESLDTGVKNITEQELRQLGSPWARWEILGEDQPGPQGMARGGKVVEQTAETDHVDPASAVGPGRIVLAEAVEPAEQMGIAAQLGEMEQLREIRLKIGEEVTGNATIAVRRAEPHGGGESLDTGVENLTEQELGQLGSPWVRREILGEDEPWLQEMAREDQIMEQSPEPEQILLAVAIGQGRIFLAEVAEPAEQMGIAAQLGEVEQLREIRLEIGEEVTSDAAKAARRTGSQSGVESLDTRVENLTEQELG
jgi:hypothetical protein